MLFRDNWDFCQDLSRRSWDLSRNLDIVEAFWVWKWWKVSTDWEISTRKYKNPRTSRSRSRQTVEKRQNFQISTNFSISIETFWSGRWYRDKIEISRSRSRYLVRRDLLFDAVKIFSTVDSHSLTTSRSRVSIETTSRQIETPKATKYDIFDEHCRNLQRNFQNNYVSLYPPRYLSHVWNELADPRTFKITENGPWLKNSGHPWSKTSSAKNINCLKHQLLKTSIG